ncbi:MAG: hypothetical protein HYY04_12670 [Chloroflexi bacterium]|nr:hypothetical protein [Chloroflexota bacterium]
MDWRHRGRLIVGGAMVISLALTACGTGGATGQRAAAGDEATSGKTPSELRVVGTDFRFEPATFQLTAGQPVRLVFRNDGKVPHDLVIAGMGADMHEEMGHQEADSHGAKEAKADDHQADEADHHADEADHHASEAKVHINADPGKTEMVVFTPTSSGSYQVVCTFPGHKEAGMVGKVTVAGDTVSLH